MFGTSHRILGSQKSPGLAIPRKLESQKRWTIHFLRSNLLTSAGVFALILFAAPSLIVYSQDVPSQLPRGVYVKQQDWGEHEIVSLEDGVLGTGVAGMYATDSVRSEVWLFGTTEASKFPCLGHLYVVDEGLLNLVQTIEDPRNLTEFKTREELNELLRLISDLNSDSSGFKYEPSRMLRIGKGLRQVSNQKAYLALKEFSRLAPEFWNGGDGVGLIANYVFSVPEKELFRKRTDLIVPPEKGETNTHPTYPIVLIRGIPFCVSLGHEFLSSGHVRFIPKQLDRVPKFIDKSLVEIDDTLQVQNVLESIDSKSHRLIFSGAFGQTRKKLVYAQLISLIRKRPNASFLPEDFDMKAANVFLKNHSSWTWNNSDHRFRPPNATAPVGSKKSAD